MTLCCVCYVNYKKNREFPSCNCIIWSCATVHMLCLFRRCWTLLWQHWRHDWVQTSIPDQVLLALCHPYYLQCECLKRARTHDINMNNLCFVPTVFIYWFYIFILIGNTCIFAPEIHPPEIQQLLCVPFMGILDRLVFGHVICYSDSSHYDLQTG